MLWTYWWLKSEVTFHSFCREKVPVEISAGCCLQFLKKPLTGLANFDFNQCSIFTGCCFQLWRRFEWSNAILLRFQPHNKNSPLPTSKISPVRDRGNTILLTAAGKLGVFISDIISPEYRIYTRYLATSKMCLIFIYKGWHILALSPLLHLPWRFLHYMNTTIWSLLTDSMVEYVYIVFQEA